MVFGAHSVPKTAANRNRFSGTKILKIAEFIPTTVGFLIRIVSNRRTSCDGCLQYEETQSS